MANNTTASSRSEADILKILIATDIHLGFEEKDPVRNEDTFDTFEEILQIAFTADVDFILLGGDLFHHAKPSPYCIFKCTELLRRYCLGDKPVSVEFLSDPSHNFTNTFNPIVNYEDPNLNVSIPVFSIHGNHDDPTGHRQISAVDLLASSGLVNYFGRYHSYDEVNIEPILLSKGETKLALYGLSHIKDERLGRLFLDKKVKMLSPEDRDAWFHLLVWHQNRAVRGTKNFIPDDCLPDFLNLVVWGHEHDCRIIPEKPGDKVWITQPGSSVATSLAEGESKPKHVGILKIHHDVFKLTPVPLKTVRPFIYRDLILKTPHELERESNAPLSVTELSMTFVKQVIDGMIEESKTLGRIGRASELPLLRLNVKYKDERQVFNAIRFGQAYVGKVANPEDMIKCQPIKTTTRRNKEGDNNLEEMEVTAAERVEDIILSHFEQNPDILKCLPLNAINEGVKRFVDASDSEAPILAVEELIAETVKKLEEDMPEIDEVDEFIQNFKITRENNSLNRISNMLNDPKRSKKRSVEVEDDGNIVEIDDDDDDSDISIIDTKTKNLPTPQPATGPGSRGGRRPRGRVGSSSRGGRGSRGRGDNAAVNKASFWK